MADQQSLMSLFLNASALVKLVMLMLLSASVVSWTLIFQRWQTFKQSQIGVDEFEETFWSGVDLNKLYQKLSQSRGEITGSEERS